MSATAAPPVDDASARTALALLRELLPASDPACAIRLWDGTRWAPPGTEPAVTIVVNRPDALARLLRPRSEAALVEAYLLGDLDVEGDIFQVSTVGRAILDQRRTLRHARVALRLALRAVGRGAGRASSIDPPLRGTRHSVARDRAAVTHHYDVSNRFYELFLDPAMVYSCAIFANPDEPLATAQRRKLDTVCRKLRLQRGERLLDIGCGWGALLLHAVREFGVAAVGLTLSERQAELARRRIADAGVADRCRVELRDYRTLDDVEAFDKVASVGMFEHVGRARAAEYFATIHRVLRPGGAYLHHAIGRDPGVPQRRGLTLSNYYVFPDHELIPIGEVVAEAERQGLELRDVEALREHYALTLRRWVGALEAHRDEAVAEVGEPTWRAWRLTFASAAREFERGRDTVTQALLVKRHADGAAGLPLLRSDWYD